MDKIIRRFLFFYMQTLMKREFERFILRGKILEAIAKIRTYPLSLCKSLSARFSQGINQPSSIDFNGSDPTFVHMVQVDDHKNESLIFLLNTQMQWFCKCTGFCWESGPKYVNCKARLDVGWNGLSIHPGLCIWEIISDFKMAFALRGYSNKPGV